MMYSDLCILHWLMGLVNLGISRKGDIWFKVMVGTIIMAPMIDLRIELSVKLLSL